MFPSGLLYPFISSSSIIGFDVVKAILCIFKKLAPSSVIPFGFESITSNLSLLNASSIPFSLLSSNPVTSRRASFALVSFILLFPFISPAILLLAIFFALFITAPFSLTLNSLKVEWLIPLGEGVDIFMISTPLLLFSTYTLVFPSTLMFAYEKNVVKNVKKVSFNVRFI
ncbi:hypothetical protein STFE110948_06060 [Streptobacillus felis]